MLTEIPGNTNGTIRQYRSVLFEGGFPAACDPQVPSDHGLFGESEWRPLSKLVFVPHT